MLVRTECKRHGWQIRDVGFSRVSKSRYIKLRHHDGRKVQIRLSDHYQPHPLTVISQRPDLLKVLIKQLCGDITSPRPPISENRILRLATGIAYQQKPQTSMPTHESNNASELGQSTIKGDLGKRFAAAWSLIDDKQRLRMTKLAEQIAGTTPKLHNSTLPPVDPTQTPMIPIANAAVMLGIKPSTLRDWTRKGWIKGAEKLSGCMHYPLDAIELAASEHPRGPKARKASP